MKRILIVGVSCSGKTTLGTRLGQKLRIPLFDLDDYYWLPDWKMKSGHQFKAEVDQLTAKDQWIISGNYLVSTWERATDIIWLDYSLVVVLWRALYRSVKRSLSKESVCNGNYESLWIHFFTKHSMILWVLKTFWRRKREFPHRMAPYSANIRRFKSSRQCRRWLEKEL